MKVIGVLDLLGGRAVHARGGLRDRYTPIDAAAGLDFHAPGDALTLARIYVEHLGISELYVADLDAILHDRPQGPLTRQLTAQGVPVWLDAGVKSAAAGRQAIELGATRVVVGLETLPSYDVLRALCEQMEVTFSLDLRDGVPIVARDARIDPAPAGVMARRACDAGACAIIAIDLARVGTGSGIDTALLGRIRDSAPHVPLVAGGGVSGWDDLVRLAAVGCDGALVATALHDGRIGADHITAAKRL